MSTIENINNVIENKIQILFKMIVMIKLYTIENNTLEDELKTIYNNYIYKILLPLTDYYISKKKYGDNVKKNFDLFIFYIKEENILNKIDYYFTTININQKYIIDKKDKKKFALYCKQYTEYSTDINLSTVNISICLCGNSITFSVGKSEAVCHICGRTERLVGLVFEDEQFYYQEDQRSKHGSYISADHCKKWLDNIQAREKTEINKKILCNIHNYITINKINPEDLTTDLMRSILKVLQYTKYNDNVNLIKKLITGVAPPQLNEIEMQHVILWFNKIMAIYNSIKCKNRSNCPNHQYFIFKILDHILDHWEPDDKNLLLKCIHLQSNSTLVKNDGLWKEICIKLKGITYKATDRYFY